MAGPLRPLVAREPTTITKISIVPQQSKNARISKQTRHRHTAEEWDKLKSTIVRLYIQENSKIEDVIKALASDGFYTCRRRLLSQLQEWGEGKKTRSYKHRSNNLGIPEVTTTFPTMHEEMMDIASQEHPPIHSQPVSRTHEFRTISTGGNAVNLLTQFPDSSGTHVQLLPHNTVLSDIPHGAVDQPAWSLSNGCSSAVPRPTRPTTSAIIHSPLEYEFTSERVRDRPAEIFKQPSEAPWEIMAVNTLDQALPIQAFFQQPSLNMIVSNIAASMAGQEGQANHETISQLKYDLRLLLNLAQIRGVWPKCDSWVCGEELSLVNDLVASAPQVVLNENSRTRIAHMTTPGMRVSWHRQRRRARIDSCTLTMTTKTTGSYSTRFGYGAAFIGSSECHFNTQILVKPDESAFSLLVEVQQKQVLDGSFSSIPRISVNNIVPSNSLVFWIAFWETEKKLIRLILDGKANLRDHDERGWSLLHYAALNYRYPRMCEFLIRNGLDVDEIACSGEGETSPLWLTIIPSEVSKIDTARILLTEGADPTITLRGSRNAIAVTLFKTCDRGVWH
ncbi:hypothetical protein HD806DRAFT_296545 [Xylariaceae sp. AK1471]|nr:hypothetical protein HD806DRAFT_296545 [Xylariaceae sp. AK1471]